MSEITGIRPSVTHSIRRLRNRAYARLLGVDPGLPLLLLSRHAFDITGEPVEWAQSWYRGDRYKFVTRLRR